jgi:plastocyanin
VGIGVVLVLLAASCVFGSSSPTRTVLVDYNSDEFPTNFTDYFPSNVQVRPGDTVVFRKAWTGEPHTVTFGSYANQYGQIIGPYLKIFDEKGYAGLPPEPAAAKALDAKVPYLFDNNGNVAQNSAQPCYLTAGMPPKDTNKPCTKAQQVQPEFTGRQFWYNSGYIHYAGPSGNTFRIKIAADATPGHYFFFCLNHGPFMSGWLDIKPKGAKIPSQDALNREAQKEIESHLSLLRQNHSLAVAQRFPVPPDRLSEVQKFGVPTAVVDGKVVVRATFVGLPHMGTDDASILQFVPTTVHARVGETVSWLFLGGPNQGHTLSFDVPKYFPLFTIEKDGTVVRNPKLDEPAGGAPAVPKNAQGGGGNSSNGPPPPPVVIDGGTWNGQAFFSSGLISPAGGFVLYNMRFAKPGTYKFACLVHPLMVGTLVVSP